MILGLFAGLLVLAGVVGGGYLVLKTKGGRRPGQLVIQKEPDPRDKSRLVINPPEEEDPNSEPSKSPPKVEAPLSLDALARRIVEMVNDQRKREQRDPVTLSEEFCKECAEHAAYLARHVGTVSDLDPHDQDPGLAGYSKGGQAAGRAASVVYQEPIAALKNWLSATAHRGFLLDPELTTIGFAAARTKKDGWVSVFDWVRGRATAKRVPTDPVLYPTPTQRDVPLAFPGNEIPDPLPDAKNKLAGFPITITFPGTPRIPDSRATLEDEAGNEVRVWFSSPTRPANERFGSLQQSTICLIGRDVLRPGMRYVIRAEARVGQRDWSRAWTFTTQSPAEMRRHIYTRALDRLNYFRKASGVRPVSLDAEKSIACLAHANYLARHVDRVENLNNNEELPELPGFTETGKDVAKKAAIRVGGGASPSDAIDWMLASVLNRHLALNPGITQVALGAAQHSPRGWIWVIRLPTVFRKEDFSSTILFPGKDQKDVPCYFGREVASIVPEPEAETTAGFGITASFSPFQRVGNASASLADAAGKPIRCWMSAPDKKLPGTGNYRQILLIPKQALSPLTKYTVSMSAEVDGVSWSQTWSFTTVDLAGYRDRVTTGLLARLNDARRLAGLEAVSLDEKLSLGCQKHADYVVRNFDHPKVQGLSIHDEDPSLPGASPEGGQAGKAGVIAIITDPIDSVDGWMATLYHRIPLLDPRLKRIGYGQSQHPSKGWITVLDSASGR